MSISKTAILEQQTKIDSRSNAGSSAGNRQKLNKSMSESHIDTSRIRQKQLGHATLPKNSTIIRTEQNEQEAEAKNGCAIM